MDYTYVLTYLVGLKYTRITVCTLYISSTDTGRGYDEVKYRIKINNRLVHLFGLVYF